jgi:DNA-binding response OmpR family regulator
MNPNGPDLSSNPATTKRILVIDDDEMLRGMLVQTLERAGYEVIEASNGDAGLKLFRTHPADLVITDLIMPEKEGVETMLELRRDFPALPIIVVSGGARTSGRDYLPIARQLGVRCALAKPFSRQEILEAIRGALTAGSANP